MTIHVFTSEDAGAPTLTGEVGSLVQLLDAILVNGYGSGETAKAPVGWTVAYSDTDKRAYRMPMATNSGRYLRVDDSGVSPATEQAAHVRGYDEMADLDTGTSPIPNDGLWWRKSDSSNSTARAWVAISDGAFVWLFVDWRSLSIRGPDQFAYGDLADVPDALGFVTALFGNSSASQINPESAISGGMNASSSSSSKWLIPNDDGELDAQAVALAAHNLAGSAVGDGFLPSPDGAGVGRRIGPISAMSSTTYFGRMPGLYVPWHSINVESENLTVFVDFVGAEGAELMSIWMNSGGSSNGNGYIDITGPWR